jgi:hypothetical protein
LLRAAANASTPWAFRGIQAPICPELSSTHLPEAFRLSDTQLPRFAWINDELMGVWIPLDSRIPGLDDAESAGALASIGWPQLPFLQPLAPGTTR